MFILQKTKTILIVTFSKKFFKQRKMYTGIKLPELYCDWKSFFFKLKKKIPSFDCRVWGNYELLGLRIFRVLREKKCVKIQFLTR